MIVQLENVYKSYTQGREPVPVLHDISMTVEDDEFRIFVSGSGPQYWMILTGPLGEQLLQTPGRVQTDGTWWSFDLRGRDIRDCTLTAWVDAGETILGLLNPRSSRGPRWG